MKKLLLNFAYILVSLLLVTACDKDDLESYAGDYSGSLKTDGKYSGVWTATVSSDGNISLSILDGISRTLSGSVSSNGKFTADQTNDTQTATAQGAIDNNGNTIGTWGDDGTTYGELKGSEVKENLDHIGIWYETTNEGFYYKMIITKTSYAQYQFDDMEGNYYEFSIDEGTYTINKNNISVNPSSGGTESGKLYVIEDTLILTLKGLSSSVYKKTDPSI